MPSEAEKQVFAAILVPTLMYGRHRHFSGGGGTAAIKPPQSAICRNIQILFNMANI